MRIDLPCQWKLIFQPGQLIRIPLYMDLSRQDKFLDPDGIGNDMQKDADDRKYDDIGQVKYPYLPGLDPVHPNGKNDGGRAKLNRHEIRSVDHKHGRDQQKYDESRGIPVRLVLGDQAAEYKQHRDR